MAGSWTQGWEQVKDDPQEEKSPLTEGKLQVRAGLREDQEPDFRVLYHVVPHSTWDSQLASRVPARTASHSLPFEFQPSSWGALAPSAISGPAASPLNPMKHLLTAPPGSGGGGRGQAAAP